MKRILFVCLGNICRSPAAEGIFMKYLADEKLDGKFQIDSAGLLDYHEGENYDPRMITYASKRGYKLSGFSRSFVKEDFEKFDFIITMDDEVFNTLRKLDRKKLYHNKIYKMIDFYSKRDYDEVPDPYYANSNGFEIVLDILEDSCKRLLSKLKHDNNK